MTLTSILIAAIPTILGIISTMIAYKFNPKRIIVSELDDIDKKLDILEAKRDEAINKKDNMSLTIIISDINKLHKRSSEINKRL